MNYLTLDPQVENVVSDCVTALFDECMTHGATVLTVKARNARFVGEDGKTIDCGDWELKFRQVRKPVRPLPGQLALPFDGAEE